MKGRRKPGYNALEITFYSQLEEDYLIDLIEYGITRMQFPSSVNEKSTLTTFKETVKFGNQLLDIIREHK